MGARMRSFTPIELADVVGGRLKSASQLEIGPDVVIDSRLATTGSLFVALAGERVDGHDYVRYAVELGAVAALVTHKVEADCTQIVVPNTLDALSDLARFVVAEAVSQSGLSVLALTGSSGKTSTKDLLAQVLSDADLTVAPAGNHNNEIGVPLTACQVSRHTRFLVAELGARKVGDIAHLTTIVPPKIAAMLNIGTAHIGEFGGREQIAAAKAEIIEALPADGWAILNADDPLIVACSSSTQAQICWFALDGASPRLGDNLVWASEIKADETERYSFVLNVQVKGVRASHQVSLQVMGAHQVQNALAAAAMALTAGLEPKQIACSLSAAQPKSVWRMEIRRTRGGAVVINDSYNANPESMRSAIDTLARLGKQAKVQHREAKTIAILGDMAELGDASNSEHHRLGHYAAELGIDVVIAIGEFADQINAGTQGFATQTLVMSKEEVTNVVTPQAHDVILVKASRLVGLESVATALLDETQKGA